MNQLMCDDVVTKDCKSCCVSDHDRTDIMLLGSLVIRLASFSMDTIAYLSIFVLWEDSNSTTCHTVEGVEKSSNC